MKVDLDSDWLRTSMEMWRDAIDMRIPVHDKFKVHFIEQRSQLLEGFVKTATSWSMVLRACKADGHDLEALQSLNTDVDAFKQWAVDGLEELRRLGVQEAHADMLQDLLKRPDLLPRPKPPEEG